MADLTQLGLQPETLRVVLSNGADFLCTLRLSSNWPGGTTLALVFPDSSITSWSATISTTDAVFSVDKATTANVPHGQPVRLVYTNGTTDQVWAVGTVARFDG